MVHVLAQGLHEPVVVLGHARGGLVRGPLQTDLVVGVHGVRSRANAFGIDPSHEGCALVGGVRSGNDEVDGLEPCQSAPDSS